MSYEIFHLRSLIPETELKNIDAYESYGDFSFVAILYEQSVFMVVFMTLKNIGSQPLSFILLHLFSWQTVFLLTQQARRRPMESRHF